MATWTSNTIHDKAVSNLKKLGVSFDEAASVLFDPIALVREDDDAQGEARFVAVGMSSTGHLTAIRYATKKLYD